MRSIGTATKGPRCGPFVLALACAAAGAAQAGDRPYLATHSAAAEEDDDAVWSVEAWHVRRGDMRAWAVAPEYAFDPTTSLQFEFVGERAGARGAEIEFKHLFNHIARDGWGVGAVLAVESNQHPGRAWRRGSLVAKLPFTLALWDGEGALHLNAGIEKPRGERREALASVAIERELARRTVWFAEAAHEGGARLLHGGLRWWARREKVALDASLLHERGGGERRRGVVIGIGFYDL